MSVENEYGAQYPGGKWYEEIVEDGGIGGAASTERVSFSNSESWYR